MAEQFSYTQFEQHRIKFVAINHCCWEKSIRVTVLLNCIEEVKKKRAQNLANVIHKSNKYGSLIAVSDKREEKNKYRSRMRVDAFDKVYFVYLLC